MSEASRDTCAVIHRGASFASPEAEGPGRCRILFFVSGFTYRPLSLPGIVNSSLRLFCSRRVLFCYHFVLLLRLYLFRSLIKCNINYALCRLCNVHETSPSVLPVWLIVVSSLTCVYVYHIHGYLWENRYTSHLVRKLETLSSLFDHFPAWYTLNNDILRIHFKISF